MGQDALNMVHLEN